jgi:hypothetical protein
MRIALATHLENWSTQKMGDTRLRLQSAEKYELMSPRTLDVIRNPCPWEGSGKKAFLRLLCRQASLACDTTTEMYINNNAIQFQPEAKQLK